MLTSLTPYTTSLTPLTNCIGLHITILILTNAQLYLVSSKRMPKLSLCLFSWSTKGLIGFAKVDLE